MAMISGKFKGEVEPAQHEPLVEGGFAVSFSNKKDGDSVKERAEERKKPATRKKKTAE